MLKTSSMSNILDLPNECLEMVVSRMDAYSRLCFSMTNRSCMRMFYSQEDSCNVCIKRRFQEMCLKDCHRMIRNIYEGILLNGWCEACNRLTILRTQVSVVDNEERLRWICVDRCRFLCVECTSECTINSSISERWFKRYGMCGACMFEIMPHNAFI